LLQVNEALDQPLVLVVDDDHDLCHTLWDLFREHGLRAHIAHDVEVANERLRTHGFNVVLIDYRLPKGTGVDVLRSVREHNPQARTILITGHRNEAELAVKQALDQGADAVCYKPFNVPELLELTSRLAHKDVQA
jgi:DNA-binding response OmpR family regulator